MYFQLSFYLETTALSTKHSNSFKSVTINIASISANGVDLSPIPSVGLSVGRSVMHTAAGRCNGNDSIIARCVLVLHGIG